MPTGSQNDPKGSLTEAKRLLEQLIDVLDACGLEIAAAHASTALDIVISELNLPT